MPPQAQSDGEAGPKCDRDREEVDAVKKLLTDVESGRASSIRTADDFLGALPLSVRSSFIFVADSKSVQQADVDSPRVILKSPNAEVTVTFNTNPAHLGYDAVEMQLWNARAQRFELAEVRFPADSKDAALRGMNRPQVEREPAKCATCHQGPAGDRSMAHLSSKPVMDPYRFWAGFVPFSEDRLNRGSVDVKWFKSYLDRVHGGAPRYRRIATKLTSVGLDKTLASRPSVQVPSAKSWSSQPVNTPGLDISHQFLILNGCRIVEELKRRPDWDTVKWFVAGSFSCTDPTQFLDEGRNQQAKDWFTQRKTGLKSGRFDFDTLIAQTRARQNTLAEEREGRQLWFYEKQLGSVARAREQIALADRYNIRGKGRTGPSKIGSDDNRHIVSRSIFPTFETDYREVARMRYLLEPLGIEMNRWSMAIDPETYSHVEFFTEVESHPEIQSLIQETSNQCEKMAEKAKEGLGSLKKRERPVTGYSSPEELAASARTSLAGVTLAQARSKVGFLNACAACHTTAMLGAPILPFSNVADLEALIRKTSGSLGDEGEKIWDRVTRRQDLYGAMPPGMSLSDEEKRSLRVWLDIVKTGERSTKKKSPARAVASDAKSPAR